MQPIVLFYASVKFHQNISYSNRATDQIYVSYTAAVSMAFDGFRRVFRSFLFRKMTRHENEDKSRPKPERAFHSKWRARVSASQKFLYTDKDDWSNCLIALADLSLHWKHMSEGTALNVAFFMILSRNPCRHLGRALQKRVSRHMRTSKVQIRLRVRAVWSGPSLSANRIIGYCRM